MHCESGCIHNYNILVHQLALIGEKQKIHFMRCAEHIKGFDPRHILTEKDFSVAQNCPVLLLLSFTVEAKFSRCPTYDLSNDIGRVWEL